MNEPEKPCVFHDQLQKNLDTNCRAVKTKVSFKIFSWVIGFIIAGIFTSYGYTYRETKALAQHQERDQEAALYNCNSVKEKQYGIEKSQSNSEIILKGIDNKVDRILELNKENRAIIKYNTKRIDILEYERDRPGPTE